MKIKRMEIEFSCGISVGDAISELKQVKETHGYTTYGSFNGHILTSDMTEDEAYNLVIGKTKAECETYMQETIDRINKRDEEHKKNIPNLIEEWCKRARGIVREDQLSFWDEIVPVRLDDLYHGMELGATLELVEMLDVKQCTMEEAKEAFIKQGHSGMSAGLVASMVGVFSLRGEDFKDYISSR